MIPDYTTVVGVDERHLRQLSWTWPTWRRFKPSILNRPMVIFYDKDQVTEKAVREVCDHKWLDTVAWPPRELIYSGKGSGKWDDPQRYKMLAGFVHVPGMAVDTPYWLKVDTDTVAGGMDDWIDSDWFAEKPAIISQRWGFTKPGDQMLKLDTWVDTNKIHMPEWYDNPPLNLVPKSGSSRVSHPRIISWAGFFLTSFTRQVAMIANHACGTWRLPVPSQDGYMWYMAERGRLGVNRISLKSCGWKHRSSDRGIMEAVKEVMGV